MDISILQDVAKMHKTVELYNAALGDHTFATAHSKAAELALTGDKDAYDNHCHASNITKFSRYWNEAIAAAI